MNIIFDLDGTLIESRPRLYKLFQYIVPESRLTYDSYWKLKRNGVSHDILLSQKFKFEPARISEFLDTWEKKIETPEFLSLDTPFPFSFYTLKQLKNNFSLHLCTSRQNRRLVLRQLKAMKLHDLFDNIFVTEQKKNKYQLISLLTDLNSKDWIIGDTEEDIKAGKALGIKTCAVLSGFRNKNILSSFNPDKIFISFEEFTEQHLKFHSL